MGDQIIDVDFAIHVPVDDFRHVGSTPCPAERGSFPHPSGDELEWTGFDLLPRACDADNYRDAPTTVTALERLTHDVDIADALKTVIGAAIGQRDQMRDEIAARFRSEERRV